MVTRKTPWKGKNHGMEDNQPKWFHYNGIEMIISNYKLVI